MDEVFIHFFGTEFVLVIVVVIVSMITDVILVVVVRFFLSLEYEII